MNLDELFGEKVSAPAPVNYYDPKDFTYGYELEAGDIPRNVELPPHFGSWEYAETDIVNLTGEFAGRACDPLGIDPPVGGEINTIPTKTWREQVDKVLEICDWFRAKGHEPTSSIANHGHVHIRVPGLTEDIIALKNLTQYIRDNQALTVQKLYQFARDPRMTNITYLKLDGGRMMPDFMADNIITMAKDFDDFIRIQCCGKDGVSMGMPVRYGINTYCMKHTTTIEFRCLRGSHVEEHLVSSFKFAEAFISAALNNGPSVAQILKDGDYTFPPFIYNHEDYTNWVNTKWSKERGNKVRKFVEVK